MAGAVFATLLAIATHVAVHCPISPLPLSPPSSSLRFPSNNFLQVCFLFWFGHFFNVPVLIKITLCAIVDAECLNLYKLEIGCTVFCLTRFIVEVGYSA